MSLGPIPMQTPTLKDPRYANQLANAFAAMEELKAGRSPAPSSGDQVKLSQLDPRHLCREVKREVTLYRSSDNCESDSDPSPGQFQCRYYERAELQTIQVEVRVAVQDNAALFIQTRQNSGQEVQGVFTRWEMFDPKSRQARRLEAEITPEATHYRCSLGDGLEEWTSRYDPQGPISKEL